MIRTARTSEAVAPDVVEKSTPLPAHNSWGLTPRSKQLHAFPYGVGQSRGRDKSGFNGHGGIAGVLG